MTGVYNTIWNILGAGEHTGRFLNGSTAEAVSDAIAVTEAVLIHGVSTYEEYLQHIGDEDEEEE